VWRLLTFARGVTILLICQVLFTYLDRSGRLDYGLALLVVGCDLHMHTRVGGELVLRGRARRG
jgi:hypothetical protein